MSISPEQVLEAATARHPDAHFVGPIYCVHSPVYKMVHETQQHFELIASKRVRRWVLWPIWSRETEERIATYRAPTLMGLFAKLGGREVQ